jgi:heme-degrading monooxygenase HmoA
MYRVIFEHHPKPGQEDAFIKQWQVGSDIIQSYPGARGTLLFRSKDDPKILYAMAEWESKEARDAAMETIKQREDSEWVRHGHLQYVDAHPRIVSADLIASSLPH